MFQVDSGGLYSVGDDVGGFALGTIVRLATGTDASGSSHYPAAGGMPISVRGSVSQVDEPARGDDL